MAISHRGAISFGMVHIPVGLYTATQDNDIHFNQLCKEDGSRVKYKKGCSGRGKEIGARDIVKGFEYEKGKYVTVSDDDFEQAKSEKDRTIHIIHFTDLQDIRPIYYDKTYHALPEQGGGKAFEQGSLPYPLVYNNAIPVKRILHRDIFSTPSNRVLKVNTLVTHFPSQCFIMSMTRKSQTPMKRDDQPMGCVQDPVCADHIG